MVYAKTTISKCVRRMIPFVVLASALLLAPAQTTAQGLVQILAEYRVPFDFLGVQADVQLPSGSNVSPHWTAAPTGLKTNDESRYLESGPSKFAPTGGGTNSLGLRPYGSGIDRGGTYRSFVATGSTLADNGNYHYYTNNLDGGGGTNWQSVFCSGAGCYGMLTLDTGRFEFQIAASGGEGNDSESRWGTITTKNNGFFVRGASNYEPWCYNSVLIAGTSNRPSPCYNAGSGWPNSWTVSYP